MEDRKAYIDKLSAKLKEWDDDILKLEAKVNTASAEAKVKLHEQIKDLKEKKEAARLKFNQIKEAGDDAWAEIKAGTEKSLKTLENSFKNAWKKFK